MARRPLSTPENPRVDFVSSPLVPKHSRRTPQSAARQPQCAPRYIEHVSGTARRRARRVTDAELKNEGCVRGGGGRGFAKTHKSGKNTAPGPLRARCTRKPLAFPASPRIFRVLMRYSIRFRRHIAHIPVGACVVARRRPPRSPLLVRCERPRSPEEHISAHSSTTTGRSHVPPHSNGDVVIHIRFVAEICGFSLNCDLWNPYSPQQ